MLKQVFYPHWNRLDLQMKKHFLAARMPQQDLDNLSVRAKNLENAQTELSARQQDREARLGAEMDKKISDKDLEVLEAQLKQSEESLKALRGQHCRS